MAIITYVIGNCPGCKAEGTFGNMGVYETHIMRGCRKCHYTSGHPLPPVKKKILYLDQSFLSGAFRQNVKAFESAAEKVKNLTAKQVLLVPSSTVHEDETFQWQDKPDALHKFVLATARGHSFLPHYELQLLQLEQAIDAFFAGRPSDYLVNKRDAFRRDLDVWDDYYRIEIGGYFGNPDRVREYKEKSVEGLVSLFPGWRAAPRSFAEDLQEEIHGNARGYMDAFVKLCQRLSEGDVMAIVDSPINSRIVKRLLYHVPKEVPEERHLQAVVNFLLSAHFAKTPYQDIACGIYASLRDQVVRGAYPDAEKAKKTLSGFFYDVEHIATYAPYCDAFIMDRVMATIVRDGRVALEKQYGVKVFSTANWEDFRAWMDELDASIDQEHRDALKLAYPYLA